MNAKIFHCEDCHADFLAPKYRKKVELHNEIDGDFSEVSFEAVCPECGSTMVDWNYACEACGSHPMSGGSDFCIGCQMKADDALEEALMRLEHDLEVERRTAVSMLEDAIERLYERM